MHRPPLERAKIVIRLIIKGVGGLKHPPKDAHIIRTSMSTVNSYSSHASVKEKYIAMVVAARRAFIALSADALLVIILITLWFTANENFFWTTRLMPNTSLFFTVIACPEPEPKEQPRPPSVVDLVEFRSRLMARSAAVQHGSEDGSIYIPDGHENASVPEAARDVAVAERVRQVRAASDFYCGKLSFGNVFSLSMLDWDSMHSMPPDP